METNKCLVTSLKGTIESDNLFKELGCIYFDVNQQNIVNATQQQSLQLKAVDYSPWDLEVIGEGAIADSLEELETNPKQIIHKDSGQKTVYVKNANFKLKLTNKYNITQIRQQNSLNPQNSSCIVIDQQSVSYLTSLTIFTKAGAGSFCIDGLKDSKLLSTLWVFGSKDIYGDISNLKDCTNLQQIRFQNTSISGSIENLGNLINITELRIENTNCEGNLETFAQKQVDKGRTSGTLTVKALNSNVKYNGSSITSDTVTITFNENGYVIS